MNRILRFIYAALIVSTAVACHTSEIDNPNNDNQDKPKAYDNIILTASIKQTRVDYSINGDKLEQRWAENDVIYGFYGDTKADKDKKIVFTVNSVAESGVASLSPGDGWSDFLSVYKGGNLAIRLVYTGCTTTELSDLFDANGDILIDMTEQGTDRIPACMHAESYDKRSEGDITYIQFQFDNDCSIIEVFSFTGVKEDIGHYFEEASATLDEIAVDGLIEGCKYSLDNNGDLQFAPIDKTGGDDAPTKVTLGGDWSVTKDGDITYDGNIKPVFIAAVSFEGEANKRTISVSATLGSEQTLPATSYGPLNFVHGNSYYIMANPVVARTVDGVYFKTVSKAFEHASAISSEHPTDNTVTLVKDEIYGLVDHTGSNPIVEHIDIDYPVTLDLNGCLLCLGNITDYYEEKYDNGKTVSEYFFVDGGEFTITDLAGEGILISDGNNASSIIKNEGTVIIENGDIDQWGSVDVDEPIMIENYGSLTVDGGNFYSLGPVIYSYDGSNTTVSGDDTFIRCDSEDSYAISIQGNQRATDFTMTGGDVNSPSGAVRLDGNVNGEISGGTIFCAGEAHALRVAAKATCEVSGGFIYSKGEYGYPSTSAVYLNDASIGILGGEIGTLPNGSMCDSYAIYCVDSDCTISNVKIKNSPTNGGNASSIYCTTDKKDESSFVMSGGSITGGNIKIWLDKNITGKISGGTITSSGCYAIRLSGSELTIDEKNDNTITISTGSENGYPAILVEDYKSESESIPSILTILSGNISGEGGFYEDEKTKKIVGAYCGAIQLKDNVAANISGGEISSTTGYAILVGAGSECNISGSNTTVECERGCAISNGGTVAISGGSLSSDTEVGDDNYNLFFGTVENYADMTISGGSISSADLCAVTNRDNGVLTISGGTIISESETNPAVYSFRNYTKTGNDPDLTIKWAEGSSESNSPRVGPLIVSTKAHGLTYGPVSAANDSVGSTNYAIVEISGGYLWPQDDVFFSKGANSTLSINDYFFTNVGKAAGSGFESPYYDFSHSATVYVPSVFEEVTYEGYTFHFKITPSEEPDEPDGGLTIEGYKNGWGSSN